MHEEVFWRRLKFAAFIKLLADIKLYVYVLCMCVAATLDISDFALFSIGLLGAALVTLASYNASTVFRHVGVYLPWLGP